MTKLRATAWLIELIRGCLTACPRLAFVSVSYSAIGMLAKMLAFLLPLKLLLLAGSEHLPVALIGVMHTREKAPVIGLLLLCSILALALSQFLEFRIRSLAKYGGEHLFGKASGRSQATHLVRSKAFFMRIIDTLAGAIFSTAAALVLAFLDPSLCVFLVAALLFAYWLTVCGVKRWRLWMQFVTQHSDIYLNGVFAIVFFSAFGIILFKMLEDPSYHLFVAVVCLVVLRQMTAAMTRSVAAAFALVNQRNLVESLLANRLKTHEKIGVQKAIPNC